MNQNLNDRSYTIGDYLCRVYENPACYSAMAQLSASMRTQHNRCLRSEDWLEEYLTLPGTFALLMSCGRQFQLAGYLLLRRPQGRQPYVLVDAAQVHGSLGEEAYASLSCGLYYWLSVRPLQFYMPASATGFNRAIVRVPVHGFVGDQGRLTRCGWRQGGQFSRCGVDYVLYFLCAAYGLDIGQVLAEARQYALANH